MVAAAAARVKTLRDVFGNAWVLLGLAEPGATARGIVWATTRNLIALMFIHAATDLLPNLKQFISTWGIEQDAG
jgi:hypothetical protein